MNMETLNDVLFRAIATALGLDPDSPAASSRVFRAYDEMPLPHEDPKEDLCFYHVEPDADAFYELEVCPEISRWRVERMIPARLMLTLYGLNCESRAVRLGSHLFIDGFRQPLSMLRAAGIYPVPPDRPPTFDWEEDGRHWRKRADLVIRLRIRDDASDLPFAPVTVPPDIECVNGDGSV